MAAPGEVSKLTTSISNLEPVLEKIASYLIELPTAPYSRRCYTRGDFDSEVEVAQKSMPDAIRFAQACQGVRSIMRPDRYRVILNALRDHHHAHSKYIYPYLRHCLREEYVCPVMRTLRKYEGFDEATLNLSLQTLRAMDSWSWYFGRCHEYEGFDETTSNFNLSQETLRAMDVWSDSDRSNTDALEWPVYRLARESVKRREEDAERKQRAHQSSTTGHHYTVFGLIGCHFSHRSLSFILTAHAHFDKGEDFLSNVCNDNNSVISTGFTQAVVRAVCLSNEPLCAVKIKLVQLQAIMNYIQRHDMRLYHLEWAAEIFKSLLSCIDANKEFDQEYPDLLQKYRDMRDYFQTLGGFSGAVHRA